MELRPLGEIIEALENKGFNVSYAYDDLVFVESNSFLLRFDQDNPRKIHFYSHVDIDRKALPGLYADLAGRLKQNRIELIESGSFNTAESEKEKGHIDISFFEKEAAE